MKQLRELSRIAIAIAVGILIIVGALAYHRARLASVRRELATAALRADSLEAVADTTRLLALGAAGDSLAVYQRRSVQEIQRGDRLDRALRQERIARLGLQAQLAALDTSVTGGPTSETLGVRSGHFDIRKPPYTIQADAFLPAPPAAGTLDLDIQLDTLKLGLRLGCLAPNDVGIRAAQVTTFGPPWAKIQLGEVSQSPDLCRSPALAQRPGSRVLPFLLGIVAGVVGWEVIR